MRRRKTKTRKRRQCKPYTKNPRGGVCDITPCKENTYFLALGRKI